MFQNAKRSEPDVCPISDEDLGELLWKQIESQKQTNGKKEASDVASVANSASDANALLPLTDALQASFSHDANVRLSEGQMAARERLMQVIQADSARPTPPLESSPGRGRLWQRPVSRRQMTLTLLLVLLTLLAAFAYKLNKPSRSSSSCVSSSFHVGTATTPR